MASFDPIQVSIDLVPSEETLRACLIMLDLWQEYNPDKMIALVPCKDRYVYEVIQREKNSG